MNKHILITLQQKLAETGISNAEVLRNIAKEEIQYYVLNFIYHHKKHSQWIMYGGSALRICHGLNRMSIDLDFETDHAVTKTLLNSLKQEVEQHFIDKYNLSSDALAVRIISTRGLLLRFLIGQQLGIEHHSNQVHVKIDLNHFSLPNAATDRIPINRDQLAFTIKTYNMPTLMASKIAAILLRGKRGTGKNIYDEKGRDIYDLLWYMEKKVIPNLSYLRAKNIDITDFHDLFGRLNSQMNKVSIENLRQDLSPLFLDQDYIKNWLALWHENYAKLADNVYTIEALHEVRIGQRTDGSRNYWFVYEYDTEKNGSVVITYRISEYWMIDQEGRIPTAINQKLLPYIQIATKKIPERCKQYATLFYKKNSDYFKTTNNTILGRNIQAKLIIMGIDGNLNRKDQIILNRSKLLSCTLEDLM